MKRIKNNNCKSVSSTYRRKSKRMVEAQKIAAIQKEMDEMETINTDNQYVVLYESHTGEYSAKHFPDKVEADKYFKLLKKTKAIEKYYVKNGFMDTDFNTYRVLPLNDAIGIDGKQVWAVSHKCLFEGHPLMTDWINYFQTKEEAQQLYNYRAEIYRKQAEPLSYAQIEEDDEHEQMLVLINDEPTIYLDYYRCPIGEITDEGSWTLAGMDEMITSLKNNK